MPKKESGLSIPGAIGVRMKRVCRAILVASFLVVTPGAFAQIPGPISSPEARFAGPAALEEIIAHVNGDIILKSEYDGRLQSTRDQLLQPQQGQPALKGPALEQALAAAEKDLLRNMIDESLLLQKAKDLGLTSELEVVKTMEKLRVENHLASTEALEEAITKDGMSVDEFKENIGNRYLESRVEQQEVYYKIIVTTEDLKNYYEAHKSEFVRPAGVSLAQIIVFTEKRTPDEIQGQRKKIEDALAALKKGDEFATVAQKFSEDDNASTGGELGFLEKKDISDVYAAAIDKLKSNGDISDIITMPFGFVILKLENRHEGGVLSFAIAQNEIQNIIMSQRAEPKLREYLTKLRDEGAVSVRDGYVDTGAVKTSQKGNGGNR
jgi:peptidyl-prolyl cis-trans isomerase SurA